ncbi:hypothetical protein [Longitalea arenae]|uniref:hypothetical protein n=1 Tax=Longitalea arenae TaxID=2812558 RepID=UPI001967EF28|nr:hypothetical protein [Longitalea arenae]
MQQMHVPEEDIITIDFDAGDIPASVREFRPMVFREADRFCCILGPDPEIGIFGSGTSIEEALRDWDNDFKRRIQNLQPAYNEVDQYLQDTLNTTKDKVW